MVDNFFVHGFRNLQQIQLPIHSSLVILRGANGQGKTNILEALSLAACGSSFRKEAKEFWLPFSATSIHFAQCLLHLDSGLEQKVIIARESAEAKVQMKFWQNEVPVAKQKFIGSVPVVVFEPQDMNLLYGDPSPRRSFLDNVLIQISPTYRQAFVHAKRVLLNRNHLLKAFIKGNGSLAQLTFWNEQYAVISETVQVERKRLLQFLQLHLPVFYQDFSATRLDIRIDYKMSVFDPEKYAIPEKVRGFTLSGQHRDDFEILLEDKAWSAIASRGEMRTAVLALKACVLQFLHMNSDYPPLFLLDDIFSELDEERRRLILHWQNQYQLFLSAASDIPQADHAQVFTVDSGKISY